MPTLTAAQTKERKDKMDKARKARTPVDGNETKEQAFARLATTRVNSALKRLDMLVPLGGYPHSKEQSLAIVQALNAKVQEVQNSLDNVKSEVSAFQFGSNGQ